VSFNLNFTAQQHSAKLDLLTSSITYKIQSLPSMV